MAGEFLVTSSLKDALSIIHHHVSSGTFTEIIPLMAALGRITSKAITSPEALPAFSKSTVDGFAVKAADTFGASERTPIYMEVIGEVIVGTDVVVDMEGKESPAFKMKNKFSDYSAIRISTGGMLPEGCDGVVMIEYTQSCEKNKNNRKHIIEVTHAIAPGENVIHAGEDIKKGDLIFPEGRQLRAQDIGILAGLGIIQAQVYRRPKAAILSTGPEICPIDQKPKQGQLRDINAYTVASIVNESGGDPIYMGIVPDDLEQLKNAIQSGITQADCVLVSGGSSVGSRDYTFQAITDLGPPGVLIHGLAIRPGKPTIIGFSGQIPIIGLPGHPASAVIVTQVIVRPVLYRLSGLAQSPLEAKIRYLSGQVKARLKRNIPSPPGKEDFVRVALTFNQAEGESLMASPIFGKSGLISTLIKAHGILRIPADSEGMYEGEEVDIMLF